MKNIDKEGKKEIKLELLSTFDVHSSQILHHISNFILSRGLQEKSAKIIFLHVEIDPCFAHLLIFWVRKNRPFLRVFYFRAPLLRENKMGAKINGIKVVHNFEWQEYYEIWKRLQNIKLYLYFHQYGLNRQ